MPTSRYIEEEQVPCKSNHRAQVEADVSGLREDNSTEAAVNNRKGEASHKAQGYGKARRGVFKRGSATHDGWGWDGWEFSPKGNYPSDVKKETGKSQGLERHCTIEEKEACGMDMSQLVEIQVQGQEDTKVEGPKLLAQFQTQKLWKWLKPICPMPIISLTATEDSILACKKRKGTTNPSLHDLKRLFGTPQPMENEVNEVLVEATQ